MQKLLFTISFVVFACLAYYLTITLQTYHNDAISRTALGFFTIFGRDPHLAAVGFVWQPLPSLLQVPLIALLRPAGMLLLAGPLITALFGAVSVVYVYKVARLVLEDQSQKIALLITILFATNPMILLYSAIGTSEIIFISAILATTYYLLKWKMNNLHQYLLTASFFMTLSFWSRYESLPAFVGFGLLIIAHFMYKKISFKEFESNVLLFTVPFIYTVGFWILINWLIMGDPFYFMNSPYSNAAFTADFQSVQKSAFTVLSESIQYMLERVMFLAPLLVILPLEALFVIPSLKTTQEKISQYVLLSYLTLPSLTILFFHVYQLYKGESFGWLRFYMYGLLAGIFFAVYLINKKDKLITKAVFALLVIGSLTTGLAMSDPSLGKEEHSFMQKLRNPAVVLDYSRSYADQKELALIANSLPGSVLIDTDKGFAVPLFANQPEKFVITSDEDYVEIVENYQQHVNWIIMPQPESDDRGQNKIYTLYPNIWEGAAPSLELHTDLGNWRIFKVIKPAVVTTN